MSKRRKHPMWVRKHRHIIRSRSAYTPDRWIERYRLKRLARGRVTDA